MFMLVTIITVWGLLLLDIPLLMQTIPAHSITAFQVFSPFPLQGGSSLLLGALWLFWGVALLALVVKIIISARHPGLNNRYAQRENLILSLGIVGNMHYFDTFLICLAFLLAILSWAAGTTSLFILGSFITLGLLLNKVEQSLT